MKNKGFTLIELLAVIVILAVLATIAVPIILGIINDVRDSSQKRSKELYLKAVENSIALKNLTQEFNPNTCTVQADGNLICDAGSLTVEAEGNRPCKGTITYSSGKLESETIDFCTTSNSSTGDTMVGGSGSTTGGTTSSTSFKNDSWATIISNVRNGKANVYKVGETKKIFLDGFGEYTVRISNNSTPEECNSDDFSQTACGFVVEFVDIINMQKMNSKDTSVGGWPASAMREYLNVMDGKDGSGTIYNALPDEVKAGIINTKVISGHEKDKEENYTSNDKIYLLSTKEIYGSVNSYDTVNETRQLDFYKNQNASYDAAVKYYRGVEKDWWLRSAYSMDTSSFFNFLVAGNYDHNFASRNYGVSPAFRIG